MTQNKNSGFATQNKKGGEGKMVGKGGEAIPFAEAVEKGLISYKLVGKGRPTGHIFDIEITNLTQDPITVIIPEGTAFSPKGKEAEAK